MGIAGKEEEEGMKFAKQEGRRKREEVEELRRWVMLDFTQGGWHTHTHSLAYAYAKGPEVYK